MKQIFVIGFLLLAGTSAFAAMDMQPCQPIMEKCVEGVNSLAAMNARAGGMCAKMSQTSINFNAALLSSCLRESNINTAATMPLCTPGDCGTCSKKIMPPGLSPDRIQELQKEEEKRCLGLIDPARASMEQAAAEQARAASEADSVGDKALSKLEKAAPYALMAGGAGLGAMALLGGGKDKEDKKDDDDDEPAVQDPAKLALDNCLKSSAAPSSECQVQLTTHCAGNTVDENCKKFTNFYCGTNNESSTGNARLGDPYCRGITARTFCANTANDGCPTCQDLKAQNSPACKNNPSCLQENTSVEVIAQQMKNCPTQDPKLSDPQYASLVSSANAGSGKGTLGTGGTVQTQAASNTPPTGSGPTSASTTTSAATASSGGGWAAKLRAPFNFGGSSSGSGASGNSASPAARLPAGVVGQTYGPSLLKIVSSTYEGQCSGSQLNGCGALVQPGSGTGSGSQ